MYSSQKIITKRGKTMLLKDFLHSKGIDYAPKLDGSFERFSIGEKESNGWLVGSQYSAYFGNWSTGEKFTWRSDAALEPGETQTSREEATKALLEKYNQEKMLKQKEAREKAQYIWEKASPCFSHPYLTKKQVKAYGLKISHTGQLIVPIYNDSLVSLQFIDESGSKKFLPGGQLSGSCYYIGNQSILDKVYLCEGYATGASVLEILGEKEALVCIAFNAGNLIKIAEQYKDCPTQVIICADNDMLTANNPGLSAAIEAQKILGQNKCSIKVPIFTPQESKDKNTDWNDYVKLYGYTKARAVFNMSSTPQPSLPPAKNSYTNLQDIPVTPLKWRTDKNGKGIKPTQNEVGEALYRLYGADLMREKREVFEWRNTHWVELEPVNFKHFIRGSAQILLGGHATDKDLNCYFNIFMDKLESIPAHLSFYTQMPTLSNFLDGTLHINQKEKTLEFHPHSKLDFCTWVLPYEYKAPRPANPVFQEWLDKTFRGDSEKIRAISQIGGSCLVPIFPRLVFFFGPAGTGKSTFAKLCSAFIGKDNYAACPPEEMQGFMMESLIGKRVNIITDISGGRVDKGVFKRIQDHTNILVNRKGRLAVQASIPSLHLFCGNDLPKGIDGESNAMDRRVTIIEMDQVMEEKDMEFDFEQKILAGGQGAILDFFEAGLRDLLKKGKFFNPESGKKRLQEWKLENSPISQFLFFLEKGDIEGLRIAPEGKIRQKDLYHSYETAAPNKQNLMSRVPFFREINKKYPRITVNGYDYFKGIEIIGQDLRGV